MLRTRGVWTHRASTDMKWCACDGYVDSTLTFFGEAGWSPRLGTWPAWRGCRAPLKMQRGACVRQDSSRRPHKSVLVPYRINSSLARSSTASGWVCPPPQVSSIAHSVTASRPPGNMHLCFAAAATALHSAVRRDGRVGEAVILRLVTCLARREDKKNCISHRFAWRLVSKAGAWTKCAWWAPRYMA